MFEFNMSAENNELCQRKLPVNFALENKFPITDLSLWYSGFLFSNEIGFKKIVSNLTSATSKRLNNRAVLLFGESSFISLLPELANIADIVITADVESRLLSNVRILLDCLIKSDTPEKFIENYKIAVSTSGFKGLLGNPVDSVTKVYLRPDLEEFFFLDNPERYIACKRAAEKLVFSQIQLDLRNETQCLEFSEILKESSVSLELINFTNIHSYWDDMEQAVINLISNSCVNEIRIIHSDGLTSQIDQGIFIYLSQRLKYNMELLSSSDKLKAPNIPGITLYAPSSTPVTPEGANHTNFKAP